MPHRTERKCNIHKYTGGYSCQDVATYRTKQRLEITDRSVQPPVARKFRLFVCTEHMVERYWLRSGRDIHHQFEKIPEGV